MARKSSNGCMKEAVTSGGNDTMDTMTFSGSTVGGGVGAIPRPDLKTEVL